MSTIDRPTVTCPSWCTNSPGHAAPDDEGIVWHSRTVLELDLPQLRQADGGRAPGSYVRVQLEQFTDVKPDGESSVPTVFVLTKSGDFGDAVHLTASETEQVAQAMADAARLIRLDRELVAR